MRVRLLLLFLCKFSIFTYDKYITMDIKKNDFPEWCDEDTVEEILKIISEFEEYEKEKVEVIINLDKNNDK